MPELTLEALAARMDEMERKLSALTVTVPPTRDWRTVVGLFDDDPGFAEVIAEGMAIREADREAAQRGDLTEGAE